MEGNEPRVIESALFAPGKIAMHKRERKSYYSLNGIGFLTLIPTITLPRSMDCPVFRRRIRQKKMHRKLVSEPSGITCP